MPDRGNRISVLEAKNLKLTAFMFKTIECCSQAYVINSTSVLLHEHQWELEQKKTDSTEAPMVDKNNWVKNNGKHSVAPQACYRYDGDSVGLCGLTSCQGSPYLAWIWHLPEP